MNYSVNLSSGQTVEVVIGEAAQINVEQALNYIESGRVEITKYVNEWAKPEITNYTKEYAEPIVTEIVNQKTKPLIDNYLNTTTKPQIDEYVADNVKPYADSAQDSAAKAKISKDNAKTSETNAKASELAAASSAGVASAAAVTATEAKDYTAKVLTDENLKTVGQDLQSADSNIKTVATNILNVNTVAKNIDNVNLLAPHTEAMEALAPDIMDVVTVAGITEQTKNVSENMAHVVAVDNNKANIDKAVTNEANITTVATDMNNVKTVANNIEIIDNVAWNKSNINNVSVNMPFVEGVSDNIEHVVAVDRNKSNIDNVATNKTNINKVSVNMPAVTDVSKNMADVKNAVQSANDAKLWAVGTITEKPEGSSKYWAEQAKNAVQTPDATETVKGIVRLATSDEVTAGTNDSAAITPLKLKQTVAQDLTNPSPDTVPSTKAVSDESSRITTLMNTKITNCITEIPQDIKLELNNGTLTLKAGSKVYIPNGFEANRHTLKFDKVVIESDIRVDSPSTDGPIVIYYIENNIGQAASNAQCSGPLITIEYGYWYNTRNNFIKLTSGGEVSDSNASLPLAIINASNGDWTSIDQVFNGFGYIGSTVFALPGVKGLIPNGRNADGSLKNVEFNLNEVRTFTNPHFFDGELVFGINTLRMDKAFYSDYKYNEKENFNLCPNTVWNFCFFAKCTAEYNGKITSFTPKIVFHAVDYNELAPVKDAIPTKQDIATAVNYNNISNCITEIPQDIKLELNDGTLTLKAGSKVYVPNGFKSDGTTKKFDVVTINKDYVDVQWGTVTDTNIFEIYNPDPNENLIYPWKYTFSGETAPTGYTHMVWYDTKNNLVKLTSDGGASWKSGIALPLSIQSYSNGFVTSIDQVFNGFGYIGSTIYALPGVKGLIPNGRNADGSLKNIEVSVRDIDVKTYKNFTLVEYWDVIIDFGGVGLNHVVYDEKNNNILKKSSGNITSQLKVASISFDSNSKITSFTPKTVFHALDYNDKSTVSGWSMPSNRYIDLTLGASGTTYTAPANGYFYLVKVAGKDMADIRFNNKTKDIVQEVLPKTSTNWIYLRMEAQKGDVFEIVYNAIGDTKNFRFIYAEGEK